MAIRAQSQAEPIPGYKLLERIGGGGFGEVWKAEAPGGLLKAIKFVHGTLQGAHGDDSLLQQELKSLNRVKTVRHPYILSLERYDIIDGQLMIVMELADRNLWDRFLECQKQGLPGVPRDELLRYMEEAAEALDLMNIQYQLQHLDIKPQNLFLVHNHVKVADFGLVKDLEGMNTQVTSGVTPVYAAPETFDGIISRYCDQYNLAIVYQELLTGQRPFNGTNVRQLLMQHLTGTPNLTSLPACDRGPIARSLAKKPEDRFPTCSELIQALRLAGQGIAPPPPVAQPEVTEAVAETPAVIRVSPTARSEKPPLPAKAPTPPPVQHTATSFPPVQEPASTRVGPVLAQPSRTLTTAQLKREMSVQAPEEITGDGVLFPSLVIGIGRLGLNVLQQLRKTIQERSGPPELLPHLRMLFIDSDPETIPEATEASSDGVLAETEVLLTRLNKPSHYLKPVRNRAALDSWLNLSMVCRIPRNQTTTEGLRILGRLALVDNYRSVVSKLRADLEACTNAKALQSADRQTRLGVRTNRPRVYVVAGLGGGTGSGMFIDVAYLVRHLLKTRFGYADPDVVGILLAPTAERGNKKSPALGNAFAALTELFHFSAPQVTYQAFFDESDDPINDKGAPFTRTVVLPLPEEGADPAPTRETTMLVGDYLCRELLTPLGRKADEGRAELFAANPPDEGSMLCQTFGAYRYSMPRRVLMEQVGRALTRRLVQNWLSADRQVMQKAVKARLTEQWAKLELQPEALIASLQTACERAVGQAPDAVFDSILQKALSQGEISAGSALSILGQLEQLIGRPGDSGSIPAMDALAEAGRALRRDLDQRLSDLLSGLVEDPKFRVFGAEEATHQLAAMIGEAARTHQALFDELDAHAAEAHAHIHSLVINVQKGSWWPGRKAKTAMELRDSLQRYPKARYQSLVLEQLLSVYKGLLDTWPKRVEEVNFCRQRLGEFQRTLDDPRAMAGRAAKIDLGSGRHFLPNNARSVDEAIDAILKAVKPEDLLELDNKLQAVVRRQFKSLTQLCLGAASGFADLRFVMQQQTEAHVEGILGKASVAAMYLKERPGDAEVCADVTRAFEEATPSLAGPRQSCRELRFLVVPADLAGERLGKLAKTTSEDVEVVAVTGGEDVFFYREQPQLALADLPQLGLMAEEAYRQMTSAGSFTPHTRMDVLDWLQAT
ncbi:MAG: protein kinase [Gemmataceae bacterium]|nr:protein kinase [Gemmataceae bacterium]